MSVWGALAGGLVGTVILTSGLRVSQELGWTRIDLPLLLGTVFTDDRRKASVVTLALHLAYGRIVGAFTAGF